MARFSFEPDDGRLERRFREIEGKLQHQLTFDEAIKRYEQLESECLTALGTTGGWLEMFNSDIGVHMQEGDEIWFFNSSPQDWERMAAERGLALVRAGKVVAFLLEVRS